MPNRGKPTERIRRHHAELMERLSIMRQALDALSHGQAEKATSGLQESVHFLNDELKPHARWEEESLYPVVAELVRSYGRPTATMEVEHGILLQLFREYEKAVQDLSVATQAGQPPDEAVETVKRLGWQIDGLLSAHFSEEEEVYLELADRHMSRGDVDALLHE
ncbi:MAG: hemerythrin domain-containing protein [Chloroflexota bacterium]|nr:MAG: hemerythrin domain-containing protein [Chloroflexota bacterium]